MPLLKYIPSYCYVRSGKGDPTKSPQVPHRKLPAASKAQEDSLCAHVDKDFESLQRDRMWDHKEVPDLHLVILPAEQSSTQL